MTIVTDFIVPPVGEAVDSARLVRWLVMPGQRFKAGDIIVEIETDKSIVEVPAPNPGVMVEHLIRADGLLDADTVIARIEVEGDAVADAPAARSTVSGTPGMGPESVEPAGVKPAAANAPTATAPDGRQSGVREIGSSGGNTAAGTHRKFSTPAARRLARERGIVVESLEGTGAGGRVTQADVSRASAVPGPKSTGDARGARESFVSTIHGDIGVTVWEPTATRTDTTFVLVHGMFGDRDTWTGTADVLVRSGLRVVAMDLPCHGRSRSDATSFAEIVECAAEAAARSCTGGMAFVGHSFGGAVAARVARKPALRVDALVLIAPTGMGTQIEQSFLDGMIHADSDGAMLRELRKLTVSGMTPSMAYVQEMRRAIAARRDRLTTLIRQVSWNGIQQLDVIPDLLEAEYPTVLIQGRRDAIIPWEHALNAPARTALHLVPDVGHMPQWESTSLIASIILDSTAR